MIIRSSISDANKKVPLTRSFKESALLHLDCGRAPIPITPDESKKPLVMWKQYQRKPPTEREIHRWAREWPDAATALLTEKASGFDVLDFDRWPHDWPGADRELPAGLVIKTPHGRHYPFNHIDGVRNSVSVLAPDVDIRGNGGLVIDPYSCISGKRYEILYGGFDSIDDAPPWLVAELFRPSKKAWNRVPAARPASLPGIIPEEVFTKQYPPGPIPKGRRVKTLFSIAVKLRKHGGRINEIEAYLTFLDGTLCKPPLQKSEYKDIQKILHSIKRYRRGDYRPFRVAGKEVRPQTIEPFLKECGFLSAADRIPFQEIWAAYRTWVRKNQPLFEIQGHKTFRRLARGFGLFLDTKTRSPPFPPKGGYKKTRTHARRRRLRIRRGA